MKILLDNCVPYRAKQLLLGHAVDHTSDVGFEDLANGELILKASAQYEVLLTTDKNIRHEHNLSKLPIPVLECNTRFTRFSDLRTLVPYFEQALARTKDFWFVSIDANGNLECLGPRQ